MKKVIIGLLVSSFFCSSVVCVQAVDSCLSDKVDKLSGKVDQLTDLLQGVTPGKLKQLQPKLDLRSGNKITVALKQAQNIFKYIVDKSDKLLSKRAAIATLLVVGPLFYAYSSFIDPYLLEKLLTFISKAAVFGGIRTSAPVAKGIFAGFWEAFWYYKWQVLAVSTVFVPVVVGGAIGVSMGSVVGREAAREIGGALGTKIVGIIGLAAAVS